MSKLHSNEKSKYKICTILFIQYLTTHERKYANGTSKHTESGKTYKHRSIIFDFYS